MGASTESNSRDLMPDREASQDRPAWRLDVETGTLWRGSHPLPLRAKTLSVLRLLVRRSGQVVSSSEMRDLVWVRKHGNAHGPKQCIRELRVLMTDDVDRPLYIETVGRLGYRFIGQIDVDEPRDRFSGDAQVRDPAHAPCVGRDYELDCFADGLAKAKRGARIVHLLGGEAGAGKTRLTDHFISGLPLDKDIWIGWGQCSPHPGSREPYGPLLQLLSELAERVSPLDLRNLLRQVAPSWLVQLPGLFSATEIVDRQVASAGAAPERMVRELIELLERLTLRRPGLLVLEDIHWADASTIAWLSAWSLRRAPSRLMIICTYRSDEVGDGDTVLSAALREWSIRAGFRRVDLRGLSHEAVEALFEVRFPRHGFPISLARDLAERTEGHALFIAEVIDQWLARGCVARKDGHWFLEAEASELLDALPASVQTIVGHQMKRLTKSERRLLETASIAGLTFSAAVLADGETSVEDAEQRCEDLSRRGVFIHRSAPVHWPDGTVATSYTFRHALHQQALYHDAPAATRQSQHHRIGARLEAAYQEHAADIAPILADHFERARAHASAAHYRRQSGEAALRRGAARDAGSQLRLALKLAESVPECAGRTRAELQALMSLGSALIALEGFAAVELPEIYERVSALSEQLADQTTLVPALCGLWNYHLTRADLGLASELAARLADLIDDPSDASSMASRNAAGVTEWLRGNLDLALPHIDHVSDLYDLHRHASLSIVFGEDPGIACHHYGAIVQQLLGSTDSAEQHFQTGMEIARALDQPFGVAQMLWSGAVIARERREVALVRERAEELVRVCEEADTRFWLSGGHILAGWAAAADGKRSGLDQMRHGIDAWKLGCVSLTRPYSLAIYAEACAGFGLVADGLVALAEARRLAETTGERWYDAGLCRITAVLIETSQ